jgi:hypothetical protein
VPGVGRGFEFLFGAGTETGFTHDSDDTVFAATNALIGKIPVNLGRPLNAVAGGVKDAYSVR